MAIDISELRKLPTAEKLRLAELLWDDIASSGEAIELQDWQFQEALAIDREELTTKANQPKRRQRTP